MKETADAQTGKKMRAWTEKHAELYSKHDASGYAAFSRRIQFELHRKE